MKKISFLICLFIATYSIQAQDTVYGPVPTIVNARAISTDGNIVVGKSDAGTKPAFLWNVKSGNAITSIGTTGEFFAISDDTSLVGGFFDPDILFEGNPVYSAGVWKNDNWTGLGLGAGENDGEVEADSYGSGGRAITADGKMVVGHSYKKETGTYYAHPTAWRWNGTKWVSEVWNSPAGNMPGASIKCISADGNVAVGWTTTQESSDKIGIIWTSKTSYRTPLANLDDVTEYSCLSSNGKYAGFRYRTDAAGVHNLETDEITIIEEGFIINAISNDGFAVGAYNSKTNLGKSVEKPFVWSKEMGFMDFGEFVDYYLPNLSLPSPLKNALIYNNQYYSKVQTMTPDGKNFTIQIDGVRTTKNSLYVLHIESPITVVPFPQNLKAEVSRPDRNKVILTWDAPDTDEDIVRYIIYRNNDSINTVSGSTLSYTDAGLPAETIIYEVSAVYQDKKSKKSKRQSVVIVDNYDLPFYENFDSLNLDANYWTIEKQEGRSSWASFYGAGVEGGTGLGLEIVRQPNFETSLISKPLDAQNAETIYLSYSVLLQYPIETPDTLYIDVYDGDSWRTASYKIFSAGKLMDWKSEIVDLSEYAAGKLINIRFRMKGENATMNTEYYYFDDINVDFVMPIGGAAPKGLIGKTDEKTIELAWKDPSGLFGITHAKTPTRSSFGNEGKNFIAAQKFSADELAIYNGMYLTSISAYIYQMVENPSTNISLRIAVFEDGKRVNQEQITDVLTNTWNTFKLENAIALRNDIKELIIGLEVIGHDKNELPIGADEDGRVVKRKGDLFSNDNGVTWEYLSDNTEEGFQRNWSIIGNISEMNDRDVTREWGIVGYNVYRDGVKINEDLIYGQYLSTTKYEGCYTVRAFSLASGLSGESNEVCTNGVGIINPENKADVLIYPNPANDILYIEGIVKTVTVFDMSGRSVLQRENQNTLSLGHLPAGVYVISIENENGRSVQKLIKQ